MKTEQTKTQIGTKLTPRIVIESYLTPGGRMTWSVYVDKRAPELFYTRDEAHAFARGADIGHACEQNTELVRVLRRAVPWLGKMIAEGTHKNSVLPRDAEVTLMQAEDLLARLEKE